MIMHTQEGFAVEPAMGQEILDGILKTGFAKFQLNDAGTEALSQLYAETPRFFMREDALKQRHSCPNFTYGFRPYGRQYSVDQSRPDLNESFTYWSDDPGLIANSGEIGSFLQAMHGVWNVVCGLSDATIHALALRCGLQGSPNLRRSSYIETNWYQTGVTRDLLQDRHEDGHLLTVVTADAPGLEIEYGGAMHPVTFGKGELVFMPGSLMTMLTGGLIQPLYHQVRNHGLPKRNSILFLANPPVDEITEPFIRNASNQDADIARQTREGGAMFGLPPVSPR